MNFIVMQGRVNPITPEMVLFMVSLLFFVTLAFYLAVGGVLMKFGALQCCSFLLLSTGDEEERDGTRL